MIFLLKKHNAEQIDILCYNCGRQHNVQQISFQQMSDELFLHKVILPLY
jgi:hypothetical protein